MDEDTSQNRYDRNSTLDTIFEDEDIEFEDDAVKESSLYVNLSDITEIEDRNHACQFAVCENCGNELLLSNQEAFKTFNALNYSYPVPTADKSSTPRKLKKLAELQDAGLQIEYRCPKCRSCNDCLKPIEIERISLREEAENVAIYDSVQLDLQNRRII